MGVTLKTVSVKWDPETLRMCDELQEKFSTFVEGRSQLTRLIVRLIHRSVCTDKTLQVCMDGTLQVATPKTEARKK